MVSCARTVAGLTLVCMVRNPFCMALRAMLPACKLGPGVIAQGLAVDGLDLISELANAGKNRALGALIFVMLLDGALDRHRALKVVIGKDPPT